MYNYQALLNPNEKVYFFGGMHWIVMSGSFLMLLVMTFAGLKIDAFLHTRHYFPEAGEEGITWYNIWTWLAYLPWVFTGVGVCWVIGDAIRYLSTKVLLTSHRVIVKTGWIMVDIKEVEMEEIKAARIDQMLLGRVFGYGKVYLDARFVNDNTLPLLARPFDLLKLLHTIRDHNIGEKDDKATPMTSEDLPFVQSGPEVESESSADEIPEVQAMQPKLHRHEGETPPKKEAEKPKSEDAEEAKDDTGEFLDADKSDDDGSDKQEQPKSGEEAPQISQEDLDFLHQLKEQQQQAAQPANPPSSKPRLVHPAKDTDAA